MRASTLHRQILLPAPLEPVFEFFADATNLERITPPWLHFRILTPRPIAMAPGTLIDYRLRLHGLPVGWRSVIDVWEPPHRFVDRQLRGPYRLWVHEHRFVAVSGGTQVHDEVRYAVPGGRWVERVLVRPQLERIFDYRHDLLARHFAPRPPSSGGAPGVDLA